jgi:hypothetical protein
MGVNMSGKGHPANLVGNSRQMLIKYLYCIAGGQQVSYHAANKLYGEDSVRGLR